MLNLGLWKTNVLFPVKLYTGNNEIDFTVLEGSRMVVSIGVIEIDPGTNISLKMSNSFSYEVPYQQLKEILINSIGEKKVIITDFFNFFKFDLSVIGGNAKLAIGVHIHDNAIDPAKIWDGEDTLGINGDGSIDVNIINSVSSKENIVEVYDEINDVLKDIESTILTYIAPVSKKSYLQFIEASGGNIAKFWIEINDIKKRTKRTYFGGQLNVVFQYGSSSESGLKINEGDIVKLKVEHYRPEPCMFEGSLQVLEIGE